jgi:hypothetical protein
MSICLDLSSEASRLNLPTLSNRQILRPKTGAELIAYWQSEGVINSRPDIIDSQAHARNIPHEAETR